MRRASRPLWVVANSHFDPIWRRPVAWYRRRRATIYRAALDRLSERPDFRYAFSQSLLLRQFFEDCPRDKARFLRFVRQGRLELLGAPMTIPDLNLSGGEAIIRNQVMGKQWAERVLGRSVRIACWEDAFGVPATMPQILLRCGFDRYRTSRMPREGKPAPTGIFRWQGRDGSILPCAAADGMAWGFGTSGNVDDPPPTRAQRVEFCRADLFPVKPHAAFPPMFLWAGEEHVPTREAVEAFLEAARSARWRTAWVTPSEHFRALDGRRAFDRGPVVREDMSRIFTGCYAMRPRQKETFFALEGWLLAAENLLAGCGRSPTALAGAWEVLFMAQFHDAFGGCHIEENARWLAREVGRAGRVVSATIRGGNLVNPSLHARQLPWIMPRGLRRGNVSVPVQPFDGEYVAATPLGALEGVLARPVPVAVRSVRRVPSIASRSGLRLVLGRKPCLDAGGETWEVPGLLRLREEVGTLWTEDYTGREWNEGAGEAVIEKIERGEIFDRAVWTGGLRWPKSPWPGFTRLGWRRSLLLFHEAPVAWLRLELDWQGNSTEIGWRLRRRGERDEPRCHGSVPFGWVPRRRYFPRKDGTASEVFPSPRWVHAGFGSTGWLILHRATPAWRVVSGGVENVLLRSPVKRWTPFYPVQPTRECWENGRHVFDFLLLPVHRFDGAEAERLGLQFASPPMAAMSPGNGVPLKLLDSIPSGLVASSLAREGEGWRVRVAEAHGRGVCWNLPAGSFGEKRDFTGQRLTARSGSLEFRPFEIADVVAKVDP
jgi:hypothetical protein